jgi:hypothetical protein
MLIYYFDSGIGNHFAKDYDVSSKKFENEKNLFLALITSASSKTAIKPIRTFIH